MDFYVKNNIEFKSVILESQEGVFTKENKILLAFFLLILLELPVFLILIKVFTNQELFKKFSLLFIGSLFVLFVAIIVFANPKLFLIHAEKEKRKLILGWIRYLFFKSFQEVLFEDIISLEVFCLNSEKNKRVILNIKNVSGQTLHLAFTVINVNDINDLARVFINLSNILGFRTYTAFQNDLVLKIAFSKNFDLINSSNDLKNINFIKYETEKLSGIFLPDIKIETKGDEKVSIIRKPNSYDIIRAIALFIIVPIIFLIAFLSKDPYKYHAIIVSLGIYSAILFYFKRYFVPIHIVLDRLTGELLIVRSFFIKTKFYLSSVREVEIKYFRVNRLGTLIFEVSALLRDNRRIIIFFVEISTNNKRKYEIFTNILSLVNFLTSNYNIPIKESGKNIAEI